MITAILVVSVASLAFGLYAHFHHLSVLSKIKADLAKVKEKLTVVP